MLVLLNFSQLLKVISLDFNDVDDILLALCLICSLVMYMHMMWCIRFFPLVGSDPLLWYLSMEVVNCNSVSIIALCLSSQYGKFLFHSHAHVNVGLIYFPLVSKLMIFPCSAKLADTQFWSMHTFASRRILSLFGWQILISEGVGVV
jgi:hypothetical protein